MITRSISTFALALVLGLGLAACGGEEEAEEPRVKGEAEVEDD